MVFAPTTRRFSINSKPCFLEEGKPSLRVDGRIIKIFRRSVEPVGTFGATFANPLDEFVCSPKERLADLKRHRRISQQAPRSPRFRIDAAKFRRIMAIHEQLLHSFFVTVFQIPLAFCGI